MITATTSIPTGFSSVSFRAFGGSFFLALRRRPRPSPNERETVADFSQVLPFLTAKDAKDAKIRIEERQANDLESGYRLMPTQQVQTILP